MANSTVTNSKYLDYAGLSHLKTVLDARYVNTTEASNHTHSYLPLAGGTMTGIIKSQSIIPVANMSYDLGSSTQAFNTTYTRYIDTKTDYNLRLKAAGTEHLNMLGGNVNSTANIIPTTTNTYNLGSSSLKWKNVYATTFTGNLTGNVTGSADSILGSYAGSLEELNNLPVANQLTYSLFSLGTDTGLGFDSSDGIVLTVSYDTTDFASQLALDDSGYNIAFRYKDDGEWMLWKKLAFADGTCATGTWSISITGNAYYSSSAGYSATAGRAIYADSAFEADTANYAHTASYAATADSASYAYNIATSNIVTTSTIDTLTDDTVSVVPNIPTSQIVNSGALRQFWVNVRNIIEDNEFVCAAALTDLNTRLDNINASISLSTPVSTTKYNILGSPTNGGELNTAYCSTSVYMQNNNLYATSDERLKEFKEDIEVDLEKLRKLPKKYFTWKGESMIDIGTSAQELLKLYPELVSYDEINDVYAVDYVKLSVIALAAVDTLYDRLKSTEDRLKAIEDKLAKLS